MERKLRVGAVSYLNTRPLVWGFENHDFSNRIVLSFEYPSKLLKQLRDGVLDIGLIPVVGIPQLKEAYIISDYCIGARGKVNSVAIFSEVPMEQLTHIYLDYQSKSSVALAMLLLKEYWKQPVEFIPAEENFIQQIDGTRGAVVIGDRALELLRSCKYHYDLAEAWNMHTGLPFAFAVWVANKPLTKDFIAEFNLATGEGMHHFAEIVANVNFPAYDLMHYYTYDLDYTLDNKMKEAINLFLEKLSLLNPLLPPVSQR